MDAYVSLWLDWLTLPGEANKQRWVGCVHMNTICIEQTKESYWF